MLSRLTSLSLVAVASLTACQATETAEQMHARMQMESDSVRVVLEAKATAFAEAINTRQPDAIARLYRDDATMMPPDMPVVVGRDNIRAAFEGMMAGMVAGTTMAFEVVDVSANGPLAVEHGAWRMTVPTLDGAATEMHGKYLIEWHRVNGEWLIAKDIWNGDAPLPPM